jgi:hypothetical protein
LRGRGRDRYANASLCGACLARELASTSAGGPWESSHKWLVGLDHFQQRRIHFVKYLRQNKKRITNTLVRSACSNN